MLRVFRMGGVVSRVSALVVALSVVALLKAQPPPPTVREATEFMEGAERQLQQLTVQEGRAAWVQSTFITYDTDLLAAAALKDLLAATAKLGKESARFNDLELPPELRRKMEILKTSLPLAAPSDPAQQTELSELSAGLEALYGKGKYCPPEKECMDLNSMSDTMAESRDPAVLLEMWKGWRTVSPPMREKYRRFVELGNKGARELGFDDLGAMWRSGYDMEPEAFERELDRLWEQVRPLYTSLHCYVRARLGEVYGTDLVPPGEPIPAHLLGNMWAQQWDNIYDLVAPPGGDPGYDLTQLLQANGYDQVKMTRSGEAFFTSLGFDPLPATFWERSLLKKPADRDVVCHPSAWDIDTVDDLRIKACLSVTGEDFSTIHHELGHSFYQRAYSTRPFLFRDGANDGFHEGIGDTIALSITPEYLKEIGLLQKLPPANADLALLMRMALDKVAFLPFGLLIDKWRWKVFSGQTPPDRYNHDWWELRRQYQGVTPPVKRGEEDFDPGAKYHVPDNTPYARYFIAHILQFQFHRALCKAAGYEGPLNRCSIHGNREAGERLARMLELGRSRPWPDALEAVTGQREMDATAILDYFAPLKEWLDEQNQGRSCGW